MDFLDWSRLGLVGSTIGRSRIGRSRIGTSTAKRCHCCILGSMGSAFSRLEAETSEERFHVQNIKIFSLILKK